MDELADRTPAWNLVARGDLETERGEVARARIAYNEAVETVTSSTGAGSGRLPSEGSPARSPATTPIGPPSSRPRRST